MLILAADSTIRGEGTTHSYIRHLGEIFLSNSISGKFLRLVSVSIFLDFIFETLSKKLKLKIFVIVIIIIFVIISMLHDLYIWYSGSDQNLCLLTSLSKCQVSHKRWSQARRPGSWRWDVKKLPSWGTKTWNNAKQSSPNMDWSYLSCFHNINIWKIVLGYVLVINSLTYECIEHIISLNNSRLSEEEGC